MTTEQDEAAKRRTAIVNERAKLLANALDRASTVCVTVGILAPVAASLYGVGASLVPTLAQVVSGAVAWLMAAITLHIMARLALGSLK